MEASRWQRIEELFGEALNLDVAERAPFLTAACGSDAGLRREVEALLGSHQRAGDFIKAPVVDEALNVINHTDITLGKKKRIGTYEVVREIGRGGMGAVYLASRADEEFKKYVAIKLIKRGMDTEDILRRFKNERQILASLDHPNIAKLLNGGTTAEGVPYFVMEYVEGQPLTEYCDSHKLSTVERLKLFREICAAVQHAHQNLVVHRDLKPSNILITSDGTPKLLDFGIAKFLNPALAPQTIAPTATMMRMMTRDYASPEQARGEPITTASDIYSLGVLLYKLLTGHHPYQFKTPLPQEIERVICESVPEKPSTMVTRTEIIELEDGKTLSLTPNSVSRTREGQPDKLRRALNGDVDNIILMAMRKEPQRRYSSVAELSEDLRRYLGGLSVLATKDTFRYRAAKFVKRHRVGVVAALLVLLSLIAGLVATIWQAQQARQERAKAEEIKNFIERTLNYSNPLSNKGGKTVRETTVTEALDEAAKRLESGEFSNQPEIKAELELVIARCYYGQGKYSLGAKHAQEFILLQRQFYGGKDPKTLIALTTWAGLLFDKGEMAESEKLYRQVLPLMREEEKKGSVKAAELAQALNHFAYLRRTQGDSREAESLFREALALNSQIPEEFRYINGTTRSTLASTLADQGRFDEALQTAYEAVAEYRQRGDSNNPNYGFALTILGGFLVDKGNFAEADADLHEAETIFRDFLTTPGLWGGDNLRNQAISLYKQGKYGEAITKADETLTLYRENFGTHYDHYPTALIIKGLSLTKMGQAKEGEKILREAVKIRTELLPKEHFWVAVANGALGECLTLQKRFTEAEPLLLSSYESLQRSQRPNSPLIRTALEQIVTLYENWGRADAAANYRSKL